MAPPVLILLLVVCAFAHGAAAEHRTLILVKPDGVQRGLVPEVLRRFTNKGYKLVGIKMFKPTKKQAEQHFADEKDKPHFNELVEYLTSGPCVATVWEGRDVIKSGGEIVGANTHWTAVPGSIRGDYARDTKHNVVHSSDSLESAQREIPIWFDEEELVDWNYTILQWM